MRFHFATVVDAAVAKTNDNFHLVFATFKRASDVSFVVQSNKKQASRQKLASGTFFLRKTFSIFDQKLLFDLFDVKEREFVLKKLFDIYKDFRIAFSFKNKQLFELTYICKTVGL